MDESLQNHGFGDFEVSQETSGAPVGVDEAEMIMGGGYVSTSEATHDRIDIDAIPNQRPQQRPGLPARPSLGRGDSVPAPHQPPPPAPPQPQADGRGFEDPLSLDMTKLAQELPRVDPAPYAFEYQDTSILPDELEEWFTYSAEERNMLLSTREHFIEEIAGCVDHEEMEDESDLGKEINWMMCSAGMKQSFMRRMLQGLETQDVSKRESCLGTLLYLVMGAWYDTAGAHVPKDDSETGQVELQSWQASNTQSVQHLQEIRDNVRLLIDDDGLTPIYEVFRVAAWRECSSESANEERSPAIRELEKHELWSSMTIIYFCLEVTRTSPDVDWMLKSRSRFFDIKPNTLILMSEIMDKIRWDDTIEISLSRLLLLYWKTVLVLFGSSSDATEAKSSFADKDLETSDSKGYPIITASPLDYHLFRQEISAKYPAYNPPAPLFPLEPENNSILPPLKPSLAKLSDINAPGLANVQGHGTSLLNQPIHIATPAPSPPPSPAVGGKGGKKMNYQTNNQFPFLYPPLDETSNQLGGKGSTDLQDLLVGRKWEGPDIPASILEAAELFAQRMRATRAMKQLWEERVEFVKYERGWKGPDEEVAVTKLDTEAGEAHKKTEEVEQTPRIHDGGIADRLQAVEDFYKSGLPHLQSVVMVLLKVILSNVTTLITQMSGQNGLQSGFQFQEGQNGDGQQKIDGLNGTNGVHQQTTPPTADELDAIRNQEITAKAVSGVLIMLLRWFKVSRMPFPRTIFGRRY